MSTKPKHEPIPEQTEKVASEVVDAAVSVHKALGPGLLESVYETCLAHELRQRGLAVETQVALPVVYRGVRMESGLRIDMVVGKQVVVEVKAVEKLTTVHEAQLLTYLKLSGYRLGFLVNFYVPLARQGIKRMVL